MTGNDRNKRLFRTVVELADQSQAEDVARLRADMLALARVPSVRDRRRRSLALWLAGPATALVTAVALFLVLTKSSAPDIRVVNGAPVEDAGSPLTTAARAAPLVFSDGSRMLLQPNGRLQIESLDPRGGDVRLTRGEADIDIRHRPQGAWRVHAGPFTVHVVGTRFAVRWDEEEARLRVSMREGKVLVSGGRLPSPVPVSAGWQLQAWGRTQRVALEPVAVAAAPALAAVPAPEPPVVAAEEEAPAPEPARQAPAPAAVRLDDWQRAFQRGDYGDAMTLARHHDFAHLCRTLGPTRLLQLGTMARYAHATGEARAALQALVDRFPNAEQSADALYLLGVLAFEGEHDHAAAAGLFARYVERWPAAPLHAQAMGRLLEAQHRLGRAEEARATAARYLALHPEGAHAAFARSLRTQQDLTLTP